MTIADVEEMTVQAMEQTTPGFVTLYAEKRMVALCVTFCWCSFY